MLSKIATAKNIKGQSYIEIIIVVGILSILFAALFTLITSSYELLNFISSRTSAVHLAQERMENIRNLSYDNIGTVGGIPPGNLLAEESVSANGLSYLVKTSVIYVDDPFDQTAPLDTLPTDYKRVRVEISWPGLADSSRNPVILISDVAPRGIESTEGGGTLSVLVFDANAQPINQAEVAIVASEVDPPVNHSFFTGTDGRLTLPGSPTCNSCYQISVTRDGYSLERTYSTEEVANPLKGHVTILPAELTEISFAIDRLSDLTIRSFSEGESGFDPLPDVSFTLQGSKIIGTDTEDSPVYKYSQELSTGSSGEVIIEDLEWDNYFFLVDGETYDFAGTNPYIPISLIPFENLDFSTTLASHSDHSLFLTFLDPAQVQVASVSAILSFETSFEEEKISGDSEDPDFGQVFFGSLDELTYSLEATASGYLDHSSEISVSGFSEEAITLEPE